MVQASNAWRTRNKNLSSYSWNIGRYIEERVYQNFNQHMIHLRLIRGQDCMCFYYNSKLPSIKPYLTTFDIHTYKNSKDKQRNRVDTIDTNANSIKYVLYKKWNKKHKKKVQWNTAIWDYLKNCNKTHIVYYILSKKVEYFFRFFCLNKYLVVYT